MTTRELVTNLISWSVLLILVQGGQKNLVGDSKINTPLPLHMQKCNALSSAYKIQPHPRSHINMSKFNCFFMKASFCLTFLKNGYHWGIKNPTPSHSGSEKRCSQSPPPPSLDQINSNHAHPLHFSNPLQYSNTLVSHQPTPLLLLQI